MVQNPYKVLGLEEGASADEVKQAYRKKARENHPDLNPNDEAATRRMNEINEAYDRIMNPEKYTRQSRPGNTTTSGYNPYGPQGPSRTGSTGTGGYADDGRGGTGYDNPYGWPGGFDFDDLFGFGGAGGAESIHPEASINDNPQVRHAIDDINAGRFKQALDTINDIPSTGRNGRWYYLAALANKGSGNTMLAFEQIRKAVQLEPTNPDYLHAQRSFQQTGAAYQQEGKERGFSMGVVGVPEICCGLMMAQMFCRPFCLGF